jgi:hypothetical protein
MVPAATAVFALLGFMVRRDHDAAAERRKANQLATSVPLRLYASKGR